MKIEKVSEDQRGEIWKIFSENKTFFLAKTHKGKARGGDIHEGKQYSIILEGKMKVLMKYEDLEKEQILGVNEMLIIPAEIPHVFIALEDTVFLEWHEFPLPPFEKKRYYEAYRKMC